MITSTLGSATSPIFATMAVRRSLMVPCGCVMTCKQGSSGMSLMCMPARSLDHESCGKLGEFLIWGASGKRALARRGRYVKRWCGAR